MFEPIAVATVEKNSREEGRITLDEYQGHRLCDVRIFADFAAGPVNTRCPTKKGVSIAASKLPTLIEALQKARAQAEASGRSRG